MLPDLYQEDGFQPKRKTSNELEGPCPFCGGTNRFTLFINEDRFWCRQCGKSGDAIQYLREVRKMSFKEAALLVRKGSSPSLDRPTTTPQSREKSKKEQPPEWLAKAERFVSYARKKLAERSDVLDWLRLERGITAETAERFLLGWNPKDAYRKKTDWGLIEDGTKMFFPSGLVIPLEKAVKIRRDNPGTYNGRPNKKYYLVKGSAAEPLSIGEPLDAVAIIVESELDAILLNQEIKRKIFVVALGSCSNRPDETLLGRLKQCAIILVALDTDKPGGISSQWWLDSVPNSFRTLTPKAYGKDITESFLNGLDLNDWLSVSLNLAQKSLPGAGNSPVEETAPFKADIECREETSHVSERNFAPVTDSPPAKSRHRSKERPSKVALEWLKDHRQALIDSGWTRSELYDRRKYRRGIVWLDLWDQAFSMAYLHKDGEIQFECSRHGRDYFQTARPRSMPTTNQPEIVSDFNNQF